MTDKSFNTTCLTESDIQKGNFNRAQTFKGKSEQIWFHGTDFGRHNLGMENSFDGIYLDNALAKKGLNASAAFAGSSRNMLNNI